ncbi:MAG: hypothetical protein PF569_00210 [Candidatus Woesearchaeota archaeon]|jgi:hypothetical protein|nr:hypothetical protein [Candidatus Woesearchaeota archaeon]
MSDSKLVEKVTLNATEVFKTQPSYSGTITLPGNQVKDLFPSISIPDEYLNKRVVIEF